MITETEQAYIARIREYFGNELVSVDTHPGVLEQIYEQTKKNLFSSLTNGTAYTVSRKKDKLSKRLIWTF